MLCKFCHNVDAAINIENKQITIDEVVEDFLKYKDFYQNGGITVSGGEPLLQMDFVIELFKRLKEYNVHTCIQTQGTLFTNTNKFKKLLELTDLFIVDLKGVDNLHAAKVCNVKIDRSLDFLDYLDKQNKNFMVTYVLIPEINDSEYCLSKLGEILSRYNPNNMSFLIHPYHRLGADKWKQLNMKYEFEHIKEPSDEETKVAVKKIQTYYEKYINKNV